jgi:C_GCAxxG_C_C family probable redox protein
MTAIGDEAPASAPDVRPPVSGQPDAVERSVEYFAEGGLYCSEAILRAFNEVHDLGLPTAAYAMATPFGAGMGAAKCSCGAVTGGQMVLGLARGRSSADASEGPAFDAAKQLHDRFRARYKVICCRGLTRKLPWGEPEHHLACQEYVRFAADEVADLLRARPDAEVAEVAEVELLG